MKNAFRMLACAVLLFTLPGVAGAVKIDMGAITCADMEKMSEAQMSMIYFWMDGYASHMSNDNSLDLDVVEENLEALSEYCKQMPKRKILDFLKN